ncbi:hypothetical protein [Bacillus stercoris]|uniref:hypothetical protein n=1 Tax=Bacillus stercoris TaxID=2054641 RepID=UPI003CF3AEDD
MKIYADEFIEAVQIIEENVGKQIAEWVEEINKDSMIECRNAFIEDTNDLDIVLIAHELDVAREIHSRLSIDEISNMICKKVKYYLQHLIEERIEESEIPITRIKDVRKFLKVVINQDAIINANTLNLCFRMGIGFKGES